jgi:hypothetical protein
MILRAPVIATLLIAGLLLGGIGYADGNRGDGKEGNIAIQWETSSPYSPTTLPSPSYVTCSIPSVTSDVLTVQVGDLGPSGGCTITGWIIDTGQFGGALSSSITITAPSGCTSFTSAGYSFSDNVAGKSIGGNDGRFKVVADFSLGPNAGAPCQSGSATATDVITAQCAKQDKKNNCCD